MTFLQDTNYIPNNVKDYLGGLKIKSLEQFYSRVYGPKFSGNATGKKCVENWADTLNVTPSELEMILKSVESDLGAEKVKELSQKPPQRPFGVLNPSLKKKK